MTTLQKKNCPVNATAYTYIIGRIRALERGLLNNRLLENALKAEDLEQSIRILSELPYVNEVIQNAAKNPNALDRALTEHFWDTLNEILKDQAIAPIGILFQMIYDFNDLKLIIKRHLAKSPNDTEYPASFEWKRALRFVTGERNEYLDDVYRKAIDDTLAGYENVHNVQVIENSIDRAFLMEVKSLADNCESRVIKNWLIAYFMFAYLRSALRAKFQQTKIDLFRSIYWENPYIRFEDLAEIVTGADEKVIETIIHLGFRELLPHDVEYKNDPRFLSEMEKNMDNYLMKFLRPYRIQAFGPEPVFGFLYAKFTDVRNLRIILHGKYFQINEIEIKSKLRECYYE
jgi:V/A-type H+-transporting ATPase subunit C